jgi:hypothetical protein
VLADPTLNASRVVEDVMLHECLHQFIEEVAGQRLVGHAQNFWLMANVIGEHLGMRPISTIEEARVWPHCVRSREFYRSS